MNAEKNGVGLQSKIVCVCTFYCHTAGLVFGNLYKYIIEQVENGVFATTVTSQIEIH